MPYDPVMVLDIYPKKVNTLKLTLDFNSTLFHLPSVLEKALGTNSLCPLPSAFYPHKQSRFPEILKFCKVRLSWWATKLTLVSLGGWTAHTMHRLSLGMQDSVLSGSTLGTLSETGEPCLCFFQILVLSFLIIVVDKVSQVKARSHIWKSPCTISELFPPFRQNNTEPPTTTNSPCASCHSIVFLDLKIKPVYAF